MQTFTPIKTGNCPLISLRSGATLTYEILCDEHNDIYIKLTGNSGGGFFSFDAIALSQVQSLLNGLAPEIPFSSTIFKRLFAGKSANNASFLAAVLCAEGVIAKSHRHTYCHVIDDIDAIGAIDAKKSHQPKKAKS